MERHVPVLVREVAERLVSQPSGIYLDGTVGSGGHSEFLLQRFANIRIIGLDRDEEALRWTEENLAQYGSRFKVYKNNFREAKKILNELGIERVSGVLLDLGVSRQQIETAERGFSYRLDGPLDMRFDRQQSLTAQKIVNEYPADLLRKIFQDFGDERFAGRLAQKIVQYRQKTFIATTRQLAGIIEKAVPKYHRRLHPARRVFQALRIKVNDELESLSQFLKNLADILVPGGRAVIISYHSGEDRLVKLSFREGVENNYYRIIPPFPVRPSPEEIKNNSRARSARLRSVEKI